MIKIQYKDRSDSVDQALGITPDRVEDLDHRMRLIIHEYFRPTKNDVYPPPDQILKLFIALAENPQELVLCSYLAGRTMQDLFGSPDIDDEDDDENTYHLKY